MGKSTLPNEIDIMKTSLYLKIMSDSTRLKILYALRNKQRSVLDIADVVNATQSAVSHQLSIMKKFNILSTKREGNKIFYFLSDSKVLKILDIVQSRM